jgi:hypothetical protein
MAKSLSASERTRNGAKLCAAKGDTCGALAVVGRNVCRHHGGNAGRPPEHGLYSEAGKRWPRLADATDKLLSIADTDRHDELLARFEALLDELAEGLGDIDTPTTECECGASVRCKTCAKVVPVERYGKMLAQAQFLHTELAKKKQFLASVVATETVVRMAEQLLKVAESVCTPSQLVALARGIDKNVKIPVTQLS